MESVVRCSCGGDDGGWDEGAGGRGVSLGDGGTTPKVLASWCQLRCGYRWRYSRQAIARPAAKCTHDVCVCFVTLSSRQRILITSDGIFVILNSGRKPSCVNSHASGPAQ